LFSYRNTKNDAILLYTAAAISAIWRVSAFSTPHLFDAPLLVNALRYQRNLHIAEKCI